ncbi:PHP domain-containing protein [Hwangdonia lutea]|uniref:Histidinol-phosphatase n=1 Tax=Hwangdonia lutea TaxID=3075823 RepID=A0AA97EMH4_9FLAO|nr:histidinol-phosphatase [Hwangdonia sp. SCSIO 19198]WOD42728.1 histidinol-phosphatase [Hwangdonia sp. SCSIO 19198]
MKTLNPLIVVFFIILSSCNKEKTESKKQWFKGNLHTHSYWSDGDEFPEVIMDWYKSNGYQFLALTDHNTLAEGDKWKTISKDSIYQNAFKNYLNTYGDDWVNYRVDSLNRTQVKLKTYEEYRPKFEEDGKFLIIQSEEITDGYNGKPIHINATNVKRKIDPQGGNSVLEVMQNNLDEVAKHKEEFGTPIIAHINHPNFGYAISLEDMIALKNEQFFEVYNGHPHVNNSGNDEHISTELMWDYINIAYIENNKPIMYGLATDDSHHYHRKGRKWSNAGRGWIMVQADTLSAKSLINAMETGQFYASTGVELSDLTFENNRLSVAVKTNENTTYKIAFIGCKKGQGEPETLASFESDKASFEIAKDMLFVRCKITSSKLHENPIEDLLFEKAWTQPYRFSE